MNAAQRYRLTRKAILRGRNHFRTIFEGGQGLRSGTILFKYHRVERAEGDEIAQSDLLTAFVVSKKHGNAVARNRARRLMREAWRLARPEFVQQLPQGIELHLILIWVGLPAAQRRPEFDAISRDLARGLQRVIASLSGKHASQPSS